MNTPTNNKYCWSTLYIDMDIDEKQAANIFLWNDYLDKIDCFSCTYYREDFQDEQV